MTTTKGRGRNFDSPIDWGAAFPFPWTLTPLVSFFRPRTKITTIKKKHQDAANPPFTCLTCASCASDRNSLDEACPDEGKQREREETEGNHHYLRRHRSLTFQKIKEKSQNRSKQRTPSGSTRSAASSSAAAVTTTSTTRASTHVRWGPPRRPGTSGAARGRDPRRRSRRRRCERPRSRRGRKKKGLPPPLPLLFLR